MPSRRVRRTVSWLAVAVMAGLTTCGVMLIVLRFGWPTGQGWTASQLLHADKAIWMPAVIAAMAPWWALAAVIVQRIERTGQAAFR